MELEKETTSAVNANEVKITLTVKGQQKQYFVRMPTAFEELEIERRKYAFNDRWDIMATSTLLTTVNVIETTETVIVFNTLIPNLSKDYGVDSLLELDKKSLYEMRRQYVDVYLPFYQNTIKAMEIY